jgi:glycerol-3-phosphate dehydrogenase (NAD(P)+)
MATIVILGAGVMGSAFTVPLADNGHVVRLVGTHLDGDIIAAVRQDHSHPRLRAHLPESVVPYTHDQLDEAMCAVDLIILGVSCAGVNWAAERLGAVLPQDVPIVMLTKGLRGDGQTMDTVPRVLKRQLPAWYRGPVGGIGGPSIAGELAIRRQTNVPLAGPDKTLVEDLAEWLRTSYYHVWPDTDVVGVEVCAALKNLYGLGVGQARIGSLKMSPGLEPLGHEEM